MEKSESVFKAAAAAELRTTHCQFTWHRNCQTAFCGVLEVERSWAISQDLPYICYMIIFGQIFVIWSFLVEEPFSIKTYHYHYLGYSKFGSRAS